MEEPSNDVARLFHKFSDLPPELRLMIWTMSFEELDCNRGVIGVSQRHAEWVHMWNQHYVEHCGDLPSVYGISKTPGYSINPVTRGKRREVLRNFDKRRDAQRTTKRWQRMPGALQVNQESRSHALRHFTLIWHANVPLFFNSKQVYFELDPTASTILTANHANGTVVQGDMVVQSTGRIFRFDGLHYTRNGMAIPDDLMANHIAQLHKIGCAIVSHEMWRIFGNMLEILASLPQLRDVRLETDICDIGNLQEFRHFVFEDQKRKREENTISYTVQVVLRPYPPPIESLRKALDTADLGRGRSEDKYVSVNYLGNGWPEGVIVCEIPPTTPASFDPDKMRKQCFEPYREWMDAVIIYEEGQ